MRLLVVWTGGVMPSYRGFFESLSVHCELVAAVPRSWKHGSRRQALGRTAGGGYHLRACGFFPQGSHRYVVPALVVLLLRFRPTHLYWMDEPDRWTVALQLGLARLLRPRMAVACYALQNLRRPRYYGWGHRAALAINRKILHGVIAASPESAKVLKERGFRRPLGCIPLGVSEAIFHPGPTGAARPTRSHSPVPVYCYTGSLAPPKGLAGFAAAVCRQPRGVLLVAGRGPLDKSLAVLPPNRVRLLGVLEDAALVEVYRKSDFVVLPSLQTPDWKEQIGRSLLEGILSGCAAVGARTGYIPEIVGDSRALFDPTDGASLDALFERLCEMDAQTLQASQRRRVLERYTWSRVAEQTHAFLETLRP